MTAREKHPIGPIAVSGRTVAYPIAHRSDAWNTVRTTRRGVSHTVARSAWKKGLINWVELSGHWLAYVDQDHVQGSGPAEVLWRVWAVDLKSGSRVLLSSNGDTPDPYVPEVNAGGGYFFWPQAEEDRSAHEYLPDGHPRSDEVLDDPFTTWTLDLKDPDASPVRVYRGIQSGLYPVAGDGFVAWATSGRSFIMRSSASGKTKKVRSGRSMATSGRHLVVAEDVGRGTEIRQIKAP